jgi:hypothetical protein
MLYLHCFMSFMTRLSPQNLVVTIHDVMFNVTNTSHSVCSLYDCHNIQSLYLLENPPTGLASGSTVLCVSYALNIIVCMNFSLQMVSQAQEHLCRYYLYWQVMEKPLEKCAVL